MQTTPTMQRVITALAQQHGLDLTKAGGHLKLELGEGWMPLVIEVLLGNLISVAHYYEQNGDLIADPDVEFEVSDQGWAPVAVQQAIAGYCNYTNNPRGQAGLADFCELWARNLEAQGWLARGRRAGEDGPALAAA